MSRHTKLNIGNGALDLWLAAGSVIGQQKWSETSVKSSGGGGYIGPQGGHISTPTISSSVQTKQEFWILDESGAESQFELTNSDFQVREGQQVWIAYGTGAGNPDNTRYLFAGNLNADKIVDMVPKWTPWLYKTRVLKRPLLYRLLTIWLPILAALFMGYVLSPIAMIDSGKIQTTYEIKQILKSKDIPSVTNLYKVWDAGFSQATTKSHWIFGIMAILTWVGSWLALNITGYLLYMAHWERRRSKKMREQIFSAVLELAEN